VRLLVVTAVEPERAAVLAGLGDGTADVIAVGVGPALAAAATAKALAERPYDAVICAGIAGGFAEHVEVGGLVVATESIAADLGAEAPDGFIPLDDLGFGTARRPADQALLERLGQALPEAVAGPVLTVSTVTGTAAGTAALRARHPDAVAEGMEGFGVASAAAVFGVAYAEVRAISNAIGPRNRDAWRIPQALAALRTASVTFAG
jgi:futalosine hydrolase